jgi:RimJ/RimL family protein N-acetyltransferase
MHFYDVRPVRSRSKNEMGQWLEGLQKGENIIGFAVRPLDKDDAIGYIEQDGILWEHGVSGFSVAIGDPANWDQGYGYEAARLALAFAFDELDLHRITATIFSYNERSIALFEKLGFQREGTFREFLQWEGKRYDMLLYGLLRWEMIK